MKYLLDTGIFIWSMDAFERINRSAQEILTQNVEELYFSAASSWEITIKAALGKLQLPEPPQQYVPARMTRQSLRALQVTHAHALAVSELPRHHNDPFDRMLIAQARSEKLVLMTADPVFEKYSVETFWCGK